MTKPRLSRIFGFEKDTTRSEKRVILVTPPSSVAPTYSRSSPDTPAEVSTDPTVPLLPLSVAYIAASLEKAGIDVKVVDLTFMKPRKLDADRIKERVLDLEPSVVGISSFTSTIPYAYRIASAIKKENSTLPIVIGGPHATALPKMTLEECPAIDAAIVGEGEYVFRDFVKTIFSKGTCDEMVDTRGLIFRYGDEFFGDPRPMYMEDLDLLPFPARHLFNQKEYVRASYSFYTRKFPVASIVTSRGCPHSCLFCARVNGGYRFRARSPENVALELQQLKEYGFNEVLIVDDAFTEDRNRVLELCKLIRDRRLNMNFNLIGGIRVDKVDKELLEAMYDAGCYSIHFGAESGDDNVLRYIRKGIKAEQIKTAVHMARKIGYQVNLYVIAGLPGSSMESEKKTLDLIKECVPDMTRVSFCTPYPGSPLWDMVKNRLKEISWDRYSETNLPNPIYMPEGLGAEQIRFWMKALSNSS